MSEQQPGDPVDEASNDSGAGGGETKGSIGISISSHASSKQKLSKYNFGQSLVRRYGLISRIIQQAEDGSCEHHGCGGGDKGNNEQKDGKDTTRTITMDDEASSLKDALVVFRLVQSDGIPIPIDIEGTGTNQNQNQTTSSSTLFVGSVGAAYNGEALASAGITHVVCACKRARLNYVAAYNTGTSNKNNLKYLRIPIDDAAGENLTRYLDQVTDWIREALLITSTGEQKKRKNNKVLVHCMQGKSRSVAIVVTYLVKYHNHVASTPKDALDVVCRTRPQAEVNHGLWRQVCQYCSELL
jgi:protein-tyrosine phosphatase